MHDTTKTNEIVHVQFVSLLFHLKIGVVIVIASYGKLERMVAVLFYRSQ